MLGRMPRAMENTLRVMSRSTSRALGGKRKLFQMMGNIVCIQ